MDIAQVLIEQLIALVAHAVSGIYSTTLKYSKKTTFIIWGIWLLLQEFLWLYGEFLTDNDGLKFILVFVSSIVSQYVVFFVTTKGKFSQRLFTILTYSIFFCIFTSYNTALQGYLCDAHVIFKMIIHIALIAGILIYFLKCVCPLCQAATKSVVTGWYSLVFANVIFLITIVATSIFPTKIENFHVPDFIPFFFFSISVFAVYPIIFTNIKNMMEIAMMREIEQQNELLLLQIEKEKLQIESDRIARHDRRHHNLILLKFAKDNDLENVKDYLKKLVESDTDVTDESDYCMNSTINTVLSAYERRANDEGINVKIYADTSVDLPISPQDLVIVIANVFENAINATKKVKLRDKYIDIDIRQKETRLLIKVENPCKTTLKFDETDYGIGITSVINTTAKYEGMCDFTAEDGIFCSKICMNF